MSEIIGLQLLGKIDLRFSFVKQYEAFVNLANKLSEDTMVKGDQVPYLTVPEINKQIAALQQPGSAYWDKRNPGHADAVEEVAALIRKKNNEENVE